MWNKLINVLGLAKGKDTTIEQPIICRWSPTLECVGNRHYWRLLVFLPGEPCNCGSYAYQPNEYSGFSKIDATKE